MLQRIVVLLLLTACGSVVVPPEETGGVGPGRDLGGADLGEAPAEVRSGAELFAANCQACHGANAAGGAVHPGSLQGRTGIAGQVRSGGGGMPAFSAAQIDDAGIAAIEAWLVWLAEPGNGDGGGIGGDVHPFARHCAGCHGPGGEGSGLAPQIRSPHEGYAGWIVRNGRSTAGSLGFPQDMPAFDRSLLPDDELDEILTFLQSQPMPGDGAALFARFCANCHGADGRGGVVGESARDEADDRSDFREVIRSGEGGSNYGSRRGFMPARLQTELSDAEIEKIRLFLGGGSGDDDDDDDDWDDDFDDDGSNDDLRLGCSTSGGGAGIALALLVLVPGATRRRRR